MNEHKKSQNTMINIYLDNKKVECKEGQSILEVARENGVHIPTLCHEPELNAYGSCWVCSVKVEGINGFVTSCGTAVRDGMSVITSSEEVHKARRTALELLLSNHYADCDAPCKTACPDHVDIQTYVSLIANGKFKEAVEVIKRNLPFPMSVGRICPAFCEDECRRQLVDEPVAIRQLKRCAADLELGGDWEYVPEKKDDKGKRIAVIGAGPAGLTCGYYLSNEGYDVDVFESMPKAGGWLRYGIPEYRLPKKVLDREIDIICRNGMKIYYRKRLGRDIFLSDLENDYDAVFLGLGAQVAVPMHLKGAEKYGLLLGVDYLRDTASGKQPEIGKKTAVIGGGDTAVDCARTALRQGAEVTLLYRRTRKEMPAEAYEVNAAMEEGVKFRFLVNPVEMLGKSGKPEKLVIEEMELGEPDESGRCRPLATGKTYTEAFDTVIAAISQKTDVSCLGNEDKIDKERLRLTKHKTAESDAETMHWRGKIFAGGDFRRGPATAIEAVADGKTASISIDRFLRGEIMRTIPAFNSEKAEKTGDIDPAEFDHIKKQERLQAEEAKAQKRRRNNEEVEKVFPGDKASEEAERCIECGCMANNNCLLRDYATEYGADQGHFAGEHARHPIDDSHPFILRDPNKCINCGRCIRICADVQGPAVLGYIYRGFSTIVGPEFGGKLEDTPCTTCGKCIEVCPTGALLPKTRSYKPNPDYYQTGSTRCTECGAACFVDIRYAGDTLLQIDPQKDNDYNGGDLCYKGKFAWQNEDLQYSAEKISDLNDIPPDTVMLISPKMTDTMITEAVAYAKEHKLTYLTTEYVPDPGDGKKGHAVMQDLMEADTIILFDPLNQMLKARARLAQLNGSKLFIVSETEDHYHRFADKIFSSAAGLQTSLPKGKNVFVYNRENCFAETRKTVWDIAKKSPSARVWVNSDYLNARGMPQFHIPAVSQLQTENIIVFGPTPDNVKTEHIIRLPLKAFSLQGTVISDSGEKIKL